MHQNDKIRKFTDLIVWQEGHKLVILVYKATKDFPKYEIYSLVNQMRRAVVSVTSNIAEGFGKPSYKEKLHYYFNAQGSLIELKNQIIIAKDIKYIDEVSFKKLIDKSDKTHKILQGLIRSTKESIHS